VTDHSDVRLHGSVAFLLISFEILPQAFSTTSISCCNAIPRWPERSLTFNFIKSCFRTFMFLEVAVQIESPHSLPSPCDADGMTQKEIGILILRYSAPLWQATGRRRKRQLSFLWEIPRVLLDEGKRRGKRISLSLTACALVTGTCFAKKN